MTQLMEPWYYNKALFYWQIIPFASLLLTILDSICEKLNLPTTEYLIFLHFSVQCYLHNIKRVGLHIISF